MGFPQTVLTSDEQVVRHLHPHWKALIAPIFWLAVCAAGTAVAWTFVENAGTIVAIVVSVVALVALAVLSFVPWLRWRTTHYVFTNERVITRVGILSRSGRDIPL
ncbi:MAG: PH domain-containing protein, partial [Micromonosporaceae bacterium]|nr:PH domain-containing protein [Micromonosporaceae bacterium]